ncbi:MAG: TlpA disulfide reductase family protein [Flavobacteriales bacterium]|nr:TlpA disulfide reductase family protein [Flavobacteriales bacterium]
MKKFLFPILLTAFIVFYWYRYMRAPSLDFAEVALVTENNTAFSLSDSLETPAIIHFHASWCGPCMKELPEIASVQHTLEAMGYHLYFITDDKFETMYNIKESFGLDGKHYRTHSLRDIGVRSLPGTQIISNSGELKYKTTGACKWKDAGFLNSLKTFVAQ